MTNIKTCESCKSPLSRSSEGWHCLSCAQTEHTPTTHHAIDIKTSSSHGTTIGDNPQPRNPVAAFVSPTIATDVAIPSQANSYKHFTNADMVVKQRNKIKQHNRKRALSAAYTVGGILVVSTMLTLASTPSKPIPRATNQAKTTASILPAEPKTVDQAAYKRDEQRKADLSEIATALHVYQKTNGNYPVGTDISVLYFMQYSNPSYIGRINYDPSSSSGGRTIKYTYRSDGTHFSLSAQLENQSDPQAQSGIYQLTD